MNFKAIHLIFDHVAYGWGAEELAEAYPQLKLGEVYATLAYFEDHRSKLMAAIETDSAEMDELAGKPEFHQLADKLRAKGDLN